MANGDFFPQSIWRFPTITLPSFVEDLGELLPTSNLLNGLSVSEDDKNVYVEAAVPGVDAKDVEVLFNKGVVTVRAEKKEEETGKKFQRKMTHSFFYRISPGDVDTQKEPQAAYKNGVMTVTFAKVTAAKPKKITVKAG